jgi:hypothetical protein
MLSKSQYLKDWRKNNAGRVQAYERRRAPLRADTLLRRKYGITTKERNRLLRGQGYRCAGCRKTKVGHWHTDHCHRTQKVRGVLCRPCNLALGFARDVPATLRRLADYLEKDRV